MTRKFWTEWEDRQLRKALIEGGHPLAFERLRGRSRYAVLHRIDQLNLDLMSLGPVRLAGRSEVAMALNVSESAAMHRLQRATLQVRRGRVLAMPACHLAALLAARPKATLTGLPTGYITTADAAAVLDMKPHNFTQNVGPKVLGRMEYAVPGGRSGRAWAYPEAAIYALRDARRRRKNHDPLPNAA